MMGQTRKETLFLGGQILVHSLTQVLLVVMPKTSYNRSGGHTIELSFLHLQKKCVSCAQGEKKLHSNTLRENQEKRAFRVGPMEPGKDIQKSLDQSYLGDTLCKKKH